MKNKYKLRFKNNKLNEGKDDKLEYKEITIESAEDIFEAIYYLLEKLSNHYFLEKISNELFDKIYRNSKNK